MTESTEQEIGFFKGLALANRTGGGSLFAFIISGAIFFGLGYYTKAQRFESKNEEIVVQATENQSITIEAHEKLKTSYDNLNDSLARLGYSKEDVEDLMGGKATRLESLKSKFTKLIKGKTIYVPRNDCGNDYLGRESSDEANDIILKGFKNRYKPND